jgi:hypothetical protein
LLGIDFNYSFLFGGPFKITSFSTNFGFASSLLDNSYFPPSPDPDPPSPSPSPSGFSST